MTDSTTPSISRDDARASVAGPGGPSRYGRERVAVGAVFFVLTGAVIVNGAIEIHRDTFHRPTVSAEDRSCSTGIHGLYDGYSALFLSVHGGPAGAGAPVDRQALAEIDERLLALRPVCIAEGDSAQDAYKSLTLWRYRVQDLSRVKERVLLPDAEHALRYQSPQAPAQSPRKYP